MWTYKSQTVFEIPESAIGFIYRITNSITGKFYIGRKMLLSNRKKRLTKKEKLITENKRKTFKREIKSTDWKEYWGSSVELKEDITVFGKGSFSREILFFCDNKTDISFWETAVQIKEDVLFRETYNRHIANTKFYKNKVTNIQTKG